MKIFLLSVLFVLNSVAYAQVKQFFPTRQLSEFADSKPFYCHRNNELLTEMAQRIPIDKEITVIARRGEKDLKRDLNKRRLHNVKEILSLKLNQPDARRKIALVEGAPIAGYGQVEIYLEGRLIEVLKVRYNRDLDVADCYAGYEGSPVCKDDWQKKFYPCKEIADKKKIGRKTLKDSNRNKRKQ